MSILNNLPLVEIPLTLATILEAATIVETIACVLEQFVLLKKIIDAAR
ncbi:MAG: hypothetical protein ABFD54_12805 [Armatimonadota bacterium]